MIESKDLFNQSIPKPIDDDELIDNIMEDEYIKKFIYENDMTREEILSGINKFLDYKEDTFTNNLGKLESKSMPGFVLELSLVDRVVKAQYVSLNPNKKRTKIKLYNVPKELVEASFADFELSNDERRKAYNYAKRFVNLFGSENMPKSMYIAGNFRSGKTYLASAIGNEIAERGYSVIEVFCPELSSILKESQFDEELSFNDIVNEMKGCDLLILDDFGGETITPRIRDEAFLVVLNYRMIKNKPVIITTNAAMNLLPQIMVKDNSDAEKFKSTRLASRISEMCEQIIIKEKYIDKKIDESIF